MKLKQKKSVMGPVISVFVMVLVISILAGLTFLFSAELKDTSIDVSSKTSLSVTNETGGFINSSGYTLATATALGFSNPSISSIVNRTDNSTLSSSLYTVDNDGLLTNATAVVVIDDAIGITYTYTRVLDEIAYKSINDTEDAGATIVGYLPLIFIALIFGAILTIVLKIILPYINLGQKVGGF